ncbi:ankyrin repeat domain-containing protein [Cardinium endosymbiont of Tipula unca]|uniref:ankyrin repeat domain-containing protein n=1 Tax=Cardinium endosymbiont of Tipula unca TaxID=3066216 RepID=UPI003BAFBA7C
MNNTSESTNYDYNTSKRKNTDATDGDIKRPKLGPEISINLQDGKGNTLLHAAVHKGLMEKVDQLLQFPGIDPNIENDDGKTALQLASTNNYAMVMLLLEIVNGSLDVNKKGENKVRILHWATYCKFPHVVELLLGIDKIDVNAKNINGNTPLHWAAYKGPIEIVAGLLQSPGIDVNTKNIKGNTPLHLAAYNGPIEIVAQLLQ